MFNLLLWIFLVSACTRKIPPKGRPNNWPKSGQIARNQCAPEKQTGSGLIFDGLPAAVQSTSTVENETRPLMLRVSAARHLRAAARVDDAGFRAPQVESRYRQSTLA